MEKIKLKLRQTPEQSFRVTLEHREEQEGSLPALPQELDESLKNWQLTYRQFEEVRSYIAPQPGQRSVDFPPGVRDASAYRLTPGKATHYGGYEYADAVKLYLNQWLNSEDSQWQNIREDLILITSSITNQSTKTSQSTQCSDSQVLVLLDVDDVRLCRLPWQEWDLFENRNLQAEIALRVKGRPGDEIKLPQKNRKVRILVVVGRSDGIRTQDDLKVIQKLKAKGAEVVSLIQPTVQELCKALWDKQGYHIFVFTGHSGSQEDGQIGWIEVNDEDSLSVEEFKHALKKAIDRGLQLAIFNSCDGLGLANQLAKLNLPRSIVMREPVPDQVAVEFLTHFFTAFTDHNSLFESVHEARRQLEHFSIRKKSKAFYPGVMWLPAICIRQSALDQPLTWKGLTSKSLPVSPFAIRLLMVTAGLAIALTGAILFNHSRLPDPLVLPTSSINVPQGYWRYGGSTTWAPIQYKVYPWIKQSYPGFELAYTRHSTLPPGSGTGIQMLLEGQLSFAESSRPLTESEYASAIQRGFNLKQMAIAIDGIAIAVNPTLNVGGLTLEQLKNIYTGQLTNWSQLGGPNLKITPYSRSLSGGTPEFFKDNILVNQSFGQGIVYVGDTTEGLRRVSQDAGGIYYASAPEVVGQCLVKPLPLSQYRGSAFVSPYQGSLISPENCPARRNRVNLEAIRNGGYPLTRRLFIIIKRDGGEDERAGEAYARLLLTPKGQSLIEESGFIPVHPVH